MALEEEKPLDSLPVPLLLSTSSFESGLFFLICTSFPLTPGNGTVVDIVSGLPQLISLTPSVTLVLVRVVSHPLGSFSNLYQVIYIYIVSPSALYPIPAPTAILVI